MAYLRQLVVVLLAGCAACDAGTFGNQAPDGAVNLALGKAYELTPPPSYKACTDAGDAVQLTDGLKRDCNWRKATTVGWRDPSTPPTVTIDLGRVEPIDEIRVHSIGGGHASVFFPTQILAMVSDDGATFRVAAVQHHPKVEPLDPAEYRRTPFVFRLRDLKTRGRYVMVALVGRARYVFMDEVEVIRGAHLAEDVAFDEDNAFPKTSVAAVLASNRMYERVREGAARLYDAGSPADGSSKHVQAAARLRNVIARTSSYVPRRVEGLQDSLRMARGAWLSGQWHKPLVWRQANPMEQVRPDDVFGPMADSKDKIEIELWQGEYESAAITIVNCTLHDMHVSVQTSPLRSPTGEMFPPDKTVILRRAVFVETRNAGVVGDALVKLNGGRMPLDPGSAGQLWMTVYNPTLGPGEYHFAVLFTLDSTADGTGELVIPGKITVHRCRFPERVSLKTCNWGYLGKLGLAGEQLMEAVRDLKAHYTNVYTITGTESPRASVRDDGILKLDFEKHDQALARFPDAELYLLWWGYTPSRLDRHKQFGRWMSPGWKAGMRQYLIRWVAHLRELEIGYDRFAMYPFDESLCAEFLELAAFIKQVDPRIQIFANSPGRRGDERVGKFIPYVDIWCLPERQQKSQSVRAKLKRNGEDQIWRYNTEVDAKSLSPYGYYRLQAWRAWADGDAGGAFWQYATGKRRESCDGWDDYICGRGRWAVVYDGLGAPEGNRDEALIPSRRWEAWREGVEDFEYLHTLRQRIEACRGRKLNARAVREAEDVLAQVAADVLGSGDDRAKVYAARRRITAAVIRLNEAAGNDDNTK